jgi:hypothetical protein
VIGLFDTIADAGALGWHSVDDKGRVYGQIAAAPSLDHGSGTLTGPYAVSATLSHEVLETLGDRFCTGWAETGRGLLIAQELGDPVEADGYEIKGVRVSNFVLPTWFDASGGSPGPFDWLGTLRAPFSMSKGGYWVQMKASAQTQSFQRTLDWMHDVGFDVRGAAARGGQLVFSSEMPDWRRELKAAGGRNAVKRAITAGLR